MDDLGVIIQAGWMIWAATWMMALDDEKKKRWFLMICRPLGEVHSCHPSIIPVSTLVFWGWVWPWQPKLSSSSHHHPRLKGPSARKISSRHHPKVQKMIIQPSSKTQGALRKKKQKNIGSHHLCAITMFQPSGMMGKSAQSSTPKVDDGLPSSMWFWEGGWFLKIIHFIITKPVLVPFRFL